MRIRSTLSAIVVLLICREALCQGLSPNPRDKIWVTNDRVSAIVPNRNKVYIGGNFTYVGPNTGCGVVLDTVAGTLRTPFPRVNNTVRAAISDNNGGWYIGGDFTKVGNRARNYIAHIFSNNTVDT